jgi:hypothetical protein
MQRTLLILCLLLIKNLCSAQDVKGLYVDGFASILGNTNREDSLLRFAQNNGFNGLTLYQMHMVHGNSSLTSVATSQGFASFVQKAKSLYGITSMGVAGENANFFKNVIHPYNLQHSNAAEQVDVYNLEFEFWINSAVNTGGYYCTTYLQPNGYACNTTGSFSFVINELHIIDSLANSIGKKSEVYIGWPDSGQGNALANCGVDRILLHIYITSANYNNSFQYNYANSRLKDIGSASTTAKISLLYSAEPNFMQAWASVNDFYKPFTDFTNSLQNETDVFKNNITVDGIQWFAYTDMPKKNMFPAVNNLDAAIKAFASVQNEKIVLQNLPEQNKTVNLFDVYGKKIYTSHTNQKDVYVDITQFTKGIYFVNVVGEKYFWQEKILVQ